MLARRDRGTTLIAEEERIRRVSEAKDYIREEATFTPALLGRIQYRIEVNAFRRCISDNTLYQSLCNSLKDKNLPERERHPDLVDFLALEAILPVQYDDHYNRVLDDLFLRCGTRVWVNNAVLEANHNWFQDHIRDAKTFIKEMISKVDSQLLEIILEDLETTFWREKLNDNDLYKKIYAKVIDNIPLNQRDVLTVVALNGGKYPTEIFRHLVVKQNSDMLHLGNNMHAQHALYDDQEYRDSALAYTLGGSPKPLTQPDVQAIPTTIASGSQERKPDVCSIGDLEAIAAAMNNTPKGRELRKKMEEMKELMSGDCTALRAVRSGRVQKSSSADARRQHIMQSIEGIEGDEGRTVEVGKSGTTVIKRETLTPHPRGSYGPHKGY